MLSNSERRAYLSEWSMADIEMIIRNKSASILVWAMGADEHGQRWSRTICRETHSVW